MTNEVKATKIFFQWNEPRNMEWEQNKEKKLDSTHEQSALIFLRCVRQELLWSWIYLTVCCQKFDS